MSVLVSTDETPAVELRDVTKVYGSGDVAVAALSGVDLRIATGEFVAMMGPSGSGKSTCMNILGCLDTPSDGSYRFRGVDAGALSRGNLDGERVEPSDRAVERDRPQHDDAGK